MARKYFNMDSFTESMHREFNESMHRERIGTDFYFDESITHPGDRPYDRRAWLRPRGWCVYPYREGIAIPASVYNAVKTASDGLPKLFLRSDYRYRLSHDLFGSDQTVAREHTYVNQMTHYEGVVTIDNQYTLVSGNGSTIMPPGYAGVSYVPPDGDSASAWTTVTNTDSEVEIVCNETLGIDDGFGGYDPIEINGELVYPTVTTTIHMTLGHTCQEYFDEAFDIYEATPWGQIRTKHDDGSIVQEYPLPNTSSPRYYGRVGAYGYSSESIYSSAGYYPAIHQFSGQKYTVKAIGWHLNRVQYNPDGSLVAGSSNVSMGYHLSDDPMTLDATGDRYEYLPELDS